MQCARSMASGVTGIERGLTAMSEARRCRPMRCSRGRAAVATTRCSSGEASPAAAHQHHGLHWRASAAYRVPWCQAAARSVRGRALGGATTCIGPIVGPAGIGWLTQSPHAHTAHMHAYLLTSTVCDSSTARSADASPVHPRPMIASTWYWSSTIRSDPIVVPLCSRYACARAR
jgi:hypothetical protein